MKFLKTLVQLVLIVVCILTVNILAKAPSVVTQRLWNIDNAKTYSDSWTIGPDNNVYYLLADKNSPSLYKIDTSNNNIIKNKVRPEIHSNNYWLGLNYYRGYFYFATSQTIFRLDYNNPSSYYEVFKIFPSETAPIYQISIDGSTGRMAIGFNGAKTLIYDFNTNSMVGITLPFGNVVFHPSTHDLYLVSGSSLVRYAVNGNGSYNTTQQVIVNNLGGFLRAYHCVAIRNEKFFFAIPSSYYMLDLITKAKTSLVTLSGLESGFITPNSKIYIGGSIGVYSVGLSADCSSLNSCNGHGSCITNGVCMCSLGWAGNSQCSAHSCELVDNCANNEACTGPNICTPCPNSFKQNSFGAPEPTVNPFYDSSTKQFSVVLTMSNTSTANVYHFVKLNPFKMENTNCKSSQPDNSPFYVVDQRTNCGTSYKYQFSTTDIFSNDSPFVISAPTDGNGLIATTFLASIYSVHREDVCTLSQFDFALQFKFSLKSSAVDFKVTKV
ncbi:hypothetical protein ABK040_002447 [Willaertia magna]